MKKKTLIFVFVTMILALLFTVSVSAGGVVYPVWVNGVQVDSNNMTDVLGNGEVSYTPGTPAALTFHKDFEISGIRCADENLAVTCGAERSVTVTLTGNYTGEKTIEFTVAPKAPNAVISLIPAEEYTGSPITPAVTVKDGEKTLTADVDYSVAYTNNTEVGTATVTVTFRGNYTGTATKDFSIVKAEIPEEPAESEQTIWPVAAIAGGVLALGGGTTAAVIVTKKKKLTK